MQHGGALVRYIYFRKIFVKSQESVTSILRVHLLEAYWDISFKVKDKLLHPVAIAHTHTQIGGFL